MTDRPNNKLSDLNNHLFAQLDRLAAANLKGDDLADEVKRADAIVAVADQVTENAKLQLVAAKLFAAKLFAEHGAQILPHLPMIGRATE